MDPKPLTIGIGYEIGCLETIHPQPHDVPMDAIVTEAGLVRAPIGTPAQRQRAAFADVDEDPNSCATYASPPCFMHELEPSYLGLEPDRGPRPADPGAAGESESAKVRGKAVPAATTTKKTDAK